MRIPTLLVIATCSLFAAQPVEQGPVHEAYVQKTSGSPLLVATKGKPPKPIDEQKPPQKEPDTVWIPGYFAKGNGWIWMSGVWRKPPPGHVWIPGRWENLSAGDWVWIPGFWSERPEDQLSYLADAPPDPLDETPNTPSLGDEQWLPGYWEYNTASQSYEWKKGHWDPLDPNWIFVPEHYTWRPEGYVFVPGYWDYPLEQRGQLFSPVRLDRETSYEPDIPLPSHQVISRLFPQYPDYLTVFHHDYTYNQRWWDSFWGTPPWWQWPNWWGLTGKNQWALFWWWSHPGYLQPEWMSEEASQEIAPPSATAVRRLKGETRPPVLGPYGAVSAHSTAKTVGTPILPSNTRKRLRQVNKANPKSVRRTRVRLRPTGAPIGTKGAGEPELIVKPEKSTTSDEANPSPSQPGKGTPPSPLLKEGVRVVPKTRTDYWWLQLPTPRKSEERKPREEEVPHPAPVPQSSEEPSIYIVPPVRQPQPRNPPQSTRSQKRDIPPAARAQLEAKRSRSHG